MLGFYENFPAFPHAKVSFVCVSPSKTIQKAIVKAAYALNNREFDLKGIASMVALNCRIGFEFGIAEGPEFNYLTQGEMQRFLKALAKKETQLNTDLFCIVKYHQNNGGKRQPLKFDNYMLRFIFRKPDVQLRLFHERGTQRLSIEELIEFLTKQVNMELERLRAQPLRVIEVIHPVPIERL